MAKTILRSGELTGLAGVRDALRVAASAVAGADIEGGTEEPGQQDTARVSHLSRPALSPFVRLA